MLKNVTKRARPIPDKNVYNYINKNLKNKIFV